MEKSPETAPASGKPRRRRMMGPALNILGLLLGGAVSVGFLLWWEQTRREQTERERVAALAKLDASAKAPATEREEPVEAKSPPKEREKPVEPKPAPKEPPAPVEPKDPLRQVNEQFRAIYHLVRSEAIARTDPIVVVSGDELLLLHKGERQTTTVTPPLYHELKTYAHVPLAAYLVTSLEPGATDVPASRQQELKKLQERIPELRADLPKHGYSAELRARQEKLLAESATFLEASRAKVDAKRREEFARKLREPIEANVRDAARSQIKALDKQMTKWRGDLSAADWKQLKVVVIGSAMPRRKNLAVQYFAWLLHEPADDTRSKRIIYAEALYEEQKALNLLGTHIVDEGIGRVFFGEPTRMKRDLLGDDAEQILEEMSRTRPQL